MPPEARGTREFSSPEVRVRSEHDYPFHPERRLWLPNERRQRRLPLGKILRLAAPWLLLATIGVGIYFGVSELLSEDAAPAAPEAVQEAGPPPEAVAAKAESFVEPVAADAQAESETEAASESIEAEPAAEPADPNPPARAEAPPEPSIHPARVEPTETIDIVTPGSIDNAPLVGERVTVEPLPAGIPRQLADGSEYDAADPTAAFSSIWPIGTTLRLTRLPGAPLLTEAQTAEVVGAEALVVVRGMVERSNFVDIQLSAAAFERLGFYDTERIIVVRAEAAAPPPAN